MEGLFIKLACRMQLHQYGHEIFRSYPFCRMNGKKSLVLDGTENAEYIYQS
jgi:hypothetical protein